MTGKLLTYGIISAVMVFSCSDADSVSRPAGGGDDPVRKQYLQWVGMKKDAIPELKNALNSDQWRVRTHALLAMGKSGDRSLAPLVLSTLKTDENQAVRNCAVIALGDLKSAESVPYLLELLAQDRTVSDKAAVSTQIIIKSLGKIGDSRAVVALYNEIINGSRTNRLAAVDSLVKIRDRSISVMLLNRKEELKKHRAERFASQLLGEMPVPGAEQFLIEGMSGKDMQNRIAAAMSLGKIKSTRAVPLLIVALKSDHGLLQKHSAESLIAINSPGAVVPLIGLFGDSRITVAMASAYVLAGMSVPGIPGQVMKRFVSTDRENAPAAYVLARKKHSPAIPLLRQRLADISQTGQDEMAEAIGWIGDRGSVPLLISVAKRRGLEGSFGAVWSLGQLKSKEAVPALLELLERDDPRLTSHVIDALGNIGDARSVAPLIEFQYGTGGKYAKMVGYALGKIGGPRVVEYIKENLDGDDEAQIMASGSALIKIRDDSFIPYSLSLLEGNNEHAKRYAIRYLQKTTGLGFRSEGEWKKWASEKSSSPR